MISINQDECLNEASLEKLCEQIAIFNRGEGFAYARWHKLKYPDATTCGQRMYCWREWHHMQRRANFRNS